MRKAAKKYKEPFNPASWTIEELAKYAMAENYDQQNYIYGMYERLLSQEKEIVILKAEAEIWRAKNAKMAEYIKNGIEFGYIDDRNGDYKKFLKEGVAFSGRV